MSNQSSNSIYDCIVVGFGGVGSAALREAAKLGWKVLGIDRFGPAHDQGSSHGQTRIIRRAYFEHPSYVPLANRAFEMWDELNKRYRTKPSRDALMTEVGLLQIGDPKSELIQGIQQSAEIHGLAIEEFTPKQIEQRLPLFKVPQNHIGLFEPEAAFLRVELCVAAAYEQALKHGAETQTNTTVQRWRVDSDGKCVVETDQGKFYSKRLVIAGGAWSSILMPDLDLGLKVLQKQQQWFQLDRVDQKLLNEFPCFLLEQDDGDCFYGFPEINYLGMKVCEHSGGKEISGPAEIDRALNKEELARTEKFMKEHMEFGRSRMVHHSTCLYSMSPDGHFFVDRYPNHDNVVFAAGLSGHGFKFACVLGKQLVDLLNGRNDPDFEFLKLAGRIK